jgi:hypothetical protein
LKLVGYDVLDDPKWRRTGFRFYWQVLAPLPSDATVSLRLVAPDGHAVDDTDLRPMPALIWYPPARWQPGETVVTEKAPWYLPAHWAPLLTVSAGSTRLAPAVSAQGPLEAMTAVSDGSLRLTPWARQDGRLVPDRQIPSGVPAAADFRTAKWGARLTGQRIPPVASPGGILPVALAWQSADPAPAPLDYIVFLHLRDANGRTVANADATPTWYVPYPTSRWQGTVDGPFTTWDMHSVVLPPDLAPGRYSLVTGWYDWQSGQRLPVTGPDGNTSGDEHVLGYVDVDPRAAPVPDLACLMVHESCASQ